MITKMKTSRFHQHLPRLSGCVLGCALAFTASAEPVANTLPVATTLSAPSESSALPPPDLSPYLNELEKIKRVQRENLELKQKLEQDKLRAELAKLHGEELGEGASPYVLALTGSSNQRQARLVVPGFGELTALPGDVLPNGWQVVEINDHAVVARRNGGAREQLPFYAPRMPEAKR